VQTCALPISALDMLGPTGNLHAFGRFRLQLKQPAGHVQAIGVFPGQGFTSYVLTVGILLVCLVDGVDRTFQIGTVAHHSVLQVARLALGASRMDGGRHALKRDYPPVGLQVTGKPQPCAGGRALIRSNPACRCSCSGLMRILTTRAKATVVKALMSAAVNRSQHRYSLPSS